MPAGVEVIVVKPRRSFPLPENIRDLDFPFRPTTIEGRETRVHNQFREGYTVGSGDNPLIVKPGRSKSDLLNKM